MGFLRDQAIRPILSTTTTFDARLPRGTIMYCMSDNRFYELEANALATDSISTATVGKVGYELPLGGTTGQILSKASDDEGDVSWVDASGGASELALLTDVDLTGLANNEVLLYNDTAGKWMPVDISVAISGAPLPASDITYINNTFGLDLGTTTSVPLMNSGGKVWTSITPKIEIQKNASTQFIADGSLNTKEFADYHLVQGDDYSYQLKGAVGTIFFDPLSGATLTYSRYGYDMFITHYNSQSGVETRALGAAGSFSTPNINGKAGIIFKTPFVCNKVRMQWGRNNLDYVYNSMITSWEFEASVDTTDGTDGNWVTLTTVMDFPVEYWITDLDDPYTGKHAFFTFTNSIPFKAYRIKVLANNGSTFYTAVPQIQFIQADVAAMGDDLTTEDLTLLNYPEVKIATRNAKEEEIFITANPISHSLKPSTTDVVEVVYDTLVVDGNITAGALVWGSNQGDLVSLYGINVMERPPTTENLQLSKLDIPIGGEAGFVLGKLSEQAGDVGWLDISLDAERVSTDIEFSTPIVGEATGVYETEVVDNLRGYKYSKMTPWMKLTTEGATVYDSSIPNLSKLNVAFGLNNFIGKSLKTNLFPEGRPTIVPISHTATQLFRYSEVWDGSPTYIYASKELTNPTTDNIKQFGTTSYDEDYDYYYGVIFPTPIAINKFSIANYPESMHSYIENTDPVTQLYSLPRSLALEASNDTTDGHDGSWATLGFAEASYMIRIPEIFEINSNVQPFKAYRIVISHIYRPDLTSIIALLASAFFETPKSPAPSDLSGVDLNTLSYPSLDIVADGTVFTASVDRRELDLDNTTITTYYETLEYPCDSIQARLTWNNSVTDTIKKLGFFDVYSKGYSIADILDLLDLRQLKPIIVEFVATDGQTSYTHTDPFDGVVQVFENGVYQYDVTISSNPTITFINPLYEGTYVKLVSEGL